MGHPDLCIKIARLPPKRPRPCHISPRMFQNTKVAIIGRHPLFASKLLVQRERFLIIPLCRRQITAGLYEIAKVAKRHGLCPIILFRLGKGQHSVIGRLRRCQIAKPIVQVPQ